MKSYWIWSTPEAAPFVGEVPEYDHARDDAPVLQHG